MKGLLPVRARFGAFRLDLRSGELCEGERRVVLSEQPFQILRMLLEREGQMVTRDEIKTTLWPNDTVVEFDHSINAAIKRLRKALEDSADDPKYIETFARRGYRMLIPVEWIASAADDSSGSDEPHPRAKEGLERGARDWVGQPRADTGSLIGKKVSHYRVLSVIGGGGMGMVYEAEDLKLDRRVALKFLPEELASDPIALQRFEREAKTASSLNHPNICTIHEVEEYEGRPCIVMELLQGQTLRDWLASEWSEEKVIPPKQILDVALQVADGLMAAHAKGIVHRDIKPANLFVTTSGQVKILDFGVAKLTSIEAIADEVPGPSPTEGQERGTPATDFHLTCTGAAMGTAGYMSPEQIRGEKVDERTDIFSFGLVLYEMAAGQRAFRGETAAIVHDGILNQTPAPVHKRNPDTPPKLEGIINRAIEKERDLRYSSAAEMRADLQCATADQPTEKKDTKVRKAARWRWPAGAAVVCVAMVAGLYWYWLSHRPPKLTERDAIVLADFDNKTADAVFDDTLKQGLYVQLEQSPFLGLVSERRVNKTLEEMGRHAGDQLTPEVTREVCQRTGSKAMLTGWISNVGRQYLIELSAMDCHTGDSLAEVQEDAPDREAVLKALDAAAISLRSKLGESPSSVQKYATPLADATTPSLEALKAYSLAGKMIGSKGQAAGLPSLRRAVELDPNFAMAYSGLAHTYGNLNEVGQAQENARKAFELRDKVSERERLSIEANYYLRVTGELDKAGQTFALLSQNYPRELGYLQNLGFIYWTLGDLEKCLEASRERARLGNLSFDGNLGSIYVSLNRLDEAEAVYKQVEKRGLSEIPPNDLGNHYQLAFLEGDRAKMTRLAAVAMDKPGIEDLLLAYQADTEAWYGKLNNARELTRRAMDSAQHDDAREMSATYRALGALRETESGYRLRARAEAEAAIKLDRSRNVQAIGAVALARAGDTTGAEKLATELDSAFPLDTLVQRYWLPTIRAAVALQRKHSNRAVDILSATSAMELAQPTGSLNLSLCPAYLRGEAYLMLHDGRAAAAEFRKFIDHYGLVGNFPWGALARLGLARAYALEAATDPAARDKARTAYQNFLTLWKDADPDIPIYKQAKAEYAKLQ